MNQTIQTLKTRRSVRQYTDETLRESDLSAIVDAGRYAASGMNRQAWRIVAVQNKQTLQKIFGETCKALGIAGSPYHGASTLILVFTDETSITPVEDATFALANMMHAAVSLGAGSCWIHASSIFFNTDAGKALQSELGIGANYTARAGGVFGYPAGDVPTALPRKENTVTILR